MDEQAFQEEALRVDREDLFALLGMRFGEVPDDARQAVLQINKSDVLQRLILVAANVPNWPAFLDELAAGEASFRLVGDIFNPLSQQPGR